MTSYLYALLTAPGVVAHELAHAFFCWISRVKIYNIKLFRFGNPAGYVEHQEPQKFYQHALISFGPLFINSFLAMVLFAGIRQPWSDYHNILFLWLGLALGLNAIPSSGDALALWRQSRRRVWRNPFVLLGWPLVLLLYFLNFLKRWHVDFVYTAGLFWLAVFGLKK